MAATLLLVDDHEDNRSALSMVLERAGYRVLGAGNGRQAVEVARETAPDLVLMDLAMPIMDGHEALRSLRDDPRTAGIPVVALTAMALTVDRERLREEGFAGLLVKPCMPLHLLAEVRRLVGPP